MNTPNQTTTKTPATILLTTKVADDGFVELIIDVVGGGFIIRDKLKASGFRFVRDEADMSAGENAKAKTSWRRILVAVPPEIPEDRIVTGLELALDELKGMLNGIFEGSRVRGAKTAAAVLLKHWEGLDDVVPIADRLAHFDSPWVNSVQRPPFAA